MRLSRLKKAIEKSWNRDTCHYKFLWDETELPPSAGHCRVVSLIVQDYYGGDIMHTHVKGNPKWDHYYNRIKGRIIDLTHDQFPARTKFVKPEKVSREEALASKRTQKGYELLKRRVKRQLE